jgi:hypothetical protein
MELYATGFNAWNQLEFRKTDTCSNNEPTDLRAFTCVLTDGELRNVEAFLTYTSGMGSCTDPKADVTVLTMVYQWRPALGTLLLV